MGRVDQNRTPEVAAVEHRLPWGVVVRGQRWGAAPDRIVLIHEPGTDLDSWSALPARLAQELSIGVAAFDLPGHGLSDDPWEPARLVDILQSLARRTELPFRQVLVAAGLTARAALDAVPDLSHTALVCLSAPSPLDADAPVRSPDAPKLFFAASQAAQDLEHARLLAGTCGGWSNVTSLPVDTSGTELLASRWSDQVAEGIISFARDFLGLREFTGRRSLAAMPDASRDASKSDTS